MTSSFTSLMVLFFKIGLIVTQLFFWGCTRVKICDKKNIDTQISQDSVQSIINKKGNVTPAFEILLGQYLRGNNNNNNRDQDILRDELSLVKQLPTQPLIPVDSQYLKINLQIFEMNLSVDSLRKKVLSNKRN